MKILEQLKDVEIVETNTRRIGVGGSEISSICGINKYSSIMDLYEYKVYGTKKDFDEESKERMHFGNILENIIAKEFSTRNNFETIEVEKLRSLSYDYCLANIDRLVVVDGVVDSILECKTANPLSINKEEVENGLIPLSYIYQVQWYMFITGIHKSYIAYLIGGQVYAQKEIKYNQELVETLLLPKAYSFWHNNVLKKIPPVIDGSEASNNYVNNKFNEATKKCIGLDENFNEYAEKVIDIKKNIKELEKELNEYQNKIKMEMGDNYKAVTSQYNISWSNRSSIRVDTEKLKADALYDKYSKKNNYRVFTIKEKK